MHINLIETRKSHDEGVSLIYPMYYDFPNEEMAYATDRLVTIFKIKIVLT
jgi:hypothetical protein